MSNKDHTSSASIQIMKNDPWAIRILPEWVVERTWEAFLGVIGSLGALFILLGNRPNSIERLLPEWIQLCWAAMLLLGCLLLLTGLATSKPLVETLGLKIFGPAAVVYGTAILYTAGWAGIGAFFPYLFFSIVSYIQAYKIRKTFISGAKFIDRVATEEEDERR